MDLILIAALAKLGIDVVMGIIQSWENSGKPTKEEMEAALIDKRPEEYFK